MKQNGNLNALRRINESVSSDKVRVTAFDPAYGQVVAQASLKERWSKPNCPLRRDFKCTIAAAQIPI
jgi:hypothetical protein